MPFLGVSAHRYFVGFTGFVNRRFYCTKSEYSGGMGEGPVHRDLYILAVGSPRYFCRLDRFVNSGGWIASLISGGWGRFCNSGGWIASLFSGGWIASLFSGGWIASLFSGGRFASLFLSDGSLRVVLASAELLAKHMQLAIVFLQDAISVNRRSGDEAGSNTPGCAVQCFEMIGRPMHQTTRGSPKSEAFNSEKYDIEKKKACRTATAQWVP